MSQYDYKAQGIYHREEGSNEERHLFQYAPHGHSHGWSPPSTQQPQDQQWYAATGGYKVSPLPQYPRMSRQDVPRGASRGYYSSGPHTSPGSASSAFVSAASPMRRPAVIKQSWAEKREYIRRSSPFGHLDGWELKAFIVKSGDDLRKEMLAMQIIGLLKKLFLFENVDMFVQDYQILSTGRQAGLVEYLEGAVSIDRIKKSYPDSPSLRAHFERQFGPSYSPSYSRALQNFVKSLAGYSLLTYVLQVCRWPLLQLCV